MSIKLQNTSEQLTEAAYTLSQPTFTTDVDYGTKYTKTANPIITFATDDIQLEGLYKVTFALTNARVLVGPCETYDWGRFECGLMYGTKHCEEWVKCDEHGNCMHTYTRPASKFVFVEGNPHITINVNPPVTTNILLDDDQYWS